MKHVLISFFLMMAGINATASDYANAVSGDNDSGIYPVVIALIMLISAVVVRLITISGQNAKSGKKPFLN